MTESIDQRLRSMDSGALDEINKYIDELKGEAQGDYDFIVKFLKKQFQTALGTDDAARAQFFSKVANQLEQRVGRIPYDFELKTGQEKEDISNTLRRMDIEDNDLRAREQEFKTQQDFEKRLETDQRQQEFNSRGLLGSGIQQKKAQQQEELRQIQTEPMRRALELERIRSGEQRQEATLQSGRRLEDITTGSRRLGQDEQTSFDKTSEQSKRSLDQRLAEIRRTGEAEKRTSLAALQAENLFKLQNV